MFSFFKKKKVEPLKPLQLSELKTDFHSHFIPGIDDGAPTMSDSISLLMEMQQLGFSNIITTPHIMGDYYRNTTEIIKKGEEEVREEINRKNLKINFSAAAEYYLDDNFERLLKEKDILTFGNNYLLFELPFMSAPNSLFEVIFKMQAAGYKPILAHPERYPFYFEDFDTLHKLKEHNVLFQMNYSSILGHYNRETQLQAEKMIDANLIDYIGSDCHNIKHIGQMWQGLTNPYLHKLFESGKLQNASL